MCVCVHACVCVCVYAYVCVNVTAYVCVCVCVCVCVWFVFVPVCSWRAHTILTHTHTWRAERTSTGSAVRARGSGVACTRSAVRWQVGICRTAHTGEVPLANLVRTRNALGARRDLDAITVYCDGSKSC